MVVDDKIIVDADYVGAVEQDFFGPHLMLDLQECNPDVLVDMAGLRSLLRNLPSKIGMTRISEPELLEYKDKWAETPGITGFVILAESHISLHTFPDSLMVFVDIFSCRNFDTRSTQRFLVDFFGSKKPVVRMAKRGLEFNRSQLALLKN